MLERLRAAVILCVLLAGAARGAVSVRDDAGNTVTLAQPARRVISMAPNVTELLFAAGGGERIVGAMNFSDYPEAAKRIPLIGSNSQIDLERVIALKPDLLVVWQSGNTASQIEQLRQLGIPVFFSEPHNFEQVATSLTRFGQLLGTDTVAQGAAAQFRARIQALGARYAGRAPVRVFYQIWDRPLYTLNGSHIVNDAIRLCGGVNIFASLKVVAPSVSTEAVLAENPEVILGGETVEAQWKAYPTMLAVQRGNLFALDGELLTRAGPRIVDGAALLCEKLDLARRRRSGAGGK